MIAALVCGECSRSPCYARCMQGNRFIGSVAALRRKLRALASVASNAGATAPEKANAGALKKQLEHRLREAGPPAGDWTDHAFRLGRWAKEIRKSGPANTAAGDWTNHANGLGKAVRRVYKKWLSG
jgi:hypothetical protein